MTWTAKQISDLNNSMVAAQNVTLGTTLDAMLTEHNAYKVRSGSIVITSNPYTFATGLATVLAGTCSFSGSPTGEHMWTTLNAGSVAGTVILTAYKPTNASTVTPILSTGSYVKTAWVAVGS